MLGGLPAQWAGTVDAGRPLPETMMEILRVLEKPEQLADKA